MNNKTLICFLCAFLIISMSFSSLAFAGEFDTPPVPFDENGGVSEVIENSDDSSGNDSDNGFVTPDVPINGGSSSSKSNSSAAKTTTKKKPSLKANTLTAKGKTKTIKYSSLKKKNVTIARKNVITLSKAKGNVTYTKKSGNKKISVNKKTGKITVKKKLKKGTYKVKIKVAAAGNSAYKAASKTVTVTIKVK